MIAFASPSEARKGTRGWLAPLTAAGRVFDRIVIALRTKADRSAFAVRLEAYSRNRRPGTLRHYKKDRNGGYKSAAVAVRTCEIIWLTFQTECPTVIRERLGVGDAGASAWGLKCFTDSEGAVA
jgi:hypothetical protein